MENSLRLRRTKNILIVDLIGNINTIEFDVHLNYIKKIKGLERIFINIRDLEDFDNELANKLYKMRMTLKQTPICIINVNATQNSILNLFQIDKIFQLYMTKTDAIEGKHPIINRQFKIVS